MPYKDPKKQKAAKDASYKRNKRAVLDRQNEARRKARDYIWNIKENSRCKVCSEDHPATLDFHHRDPKEKYIGASKMVANKYSNTRIDEELSKCDTLCANCHRKLHHELGY